MKLKQKRAPVHAKSPRPAPRKNSGGKKYTVHTVDAVGSKQSGWEVNDVYSSQGVVTLRDATAAEIFRELKDADLLNSSSKLSGMYVDDQDDQIFVHRMSDGKPIFELRAATMRNSSRRAGTLRNSAETNIGAAKAESIRSCLQAYEGAREAFDPKRYKRGGGYTPADVAEIERMAGCKSPTTEQRGELELYEFIVNPPDKYFLYVNERSGNATTFAGNVLGRVVFGRKYKSTGFGRGSTRVPVTVHGVNGVKYSGTYFESAGSYARVKRMKSKR